MMEKKSLSIRLFAVVVALACTQGASAYDFVVKGIYYNINGDEATVTYQGRYYNNYGNPYGYYNNNTGDVVIPEEVTFNGQTYTVTAIGDNAFYNYDNKYLITGITLPNTITSIGDNAFYSCSYLKEITIPNSVTTKA